jgi:hypothetical protein
MKMSFGDGIRYTGALLADACVNLLTLGRYHSNFVLSTVYKITLKEHARIDALRASRE